LGFTGRREDAKISVVSASCLRVFLFKFSYRFTDSGD
jgi:hypothetical protein